MDGKISKFAPVAIFVYRRTDLLNRVLDALEACSEFAETDVVIYSDGPKFPNFQKSVDEVRALVRNRLRPNMSLIESSENKGLAKSVISGVTDLCARYGRVIVIEDDLIVSPVALRYFNAALNQYKNDEIVDQISGHSWSPRDSTQLSDAYFLPMISSWGWATWKRAWDNFDPEFTNFQALDRDTTLRRRFDLNGHYPYYRMLRRQFDGKIDSWAIRWYWSVFQQDHLTLFPPISMVENLGKADARATHHGWGGRIKSMFTQARIRALANEVPRLPREIRINQKIYRAVCQEIRRKTSKLSIHYWLGN